MRDNILDKWDKQMILLCKGHFDVTTEPILMLGLRVIWSERNMIELKYCHLEDIWPWMLEVVQAFDKRPNLMYQIIQDARPENVWRVQIKAEEYEFDRAIIYSICSKIRHITVKDFLPNDLGWKDRMMQELIMEELMRL